MPSILTPDIPPPLPPDPQIQTRETTPAFTSVYLQVPQPEPSLPRVTLDHPVITAQVAGRLASSLVGHVLFLKNQVPLCVLPCRRVFTHLIMIPAQSRSSLASQSQKYHFSLPQKTKTHPNNSPQSNKKTEKLRTDLLVSYDTLSSHLVSTFTALGTALARRPPQKSTASPRVCRAYLVIAVGPSAGVARERVVLALDGLEVKVWGAREGNDARRAREEADQSGDSADEAGADGDDSEESDEDDDEDELDKGQEGSDSETSSDHSPPPPSPSPSPAPSLTPSPLPSRSPSPHPTHADLTHTLHLADRLLSRVLATSGQHGISASELSPTQTHLLLLAPRRFAHSCWVPKERLAGGMKGVLREFLGVETTKRKSKNVPEGVWVGCRSELEVEVDCAELAGVGVSEEVENEDEGDDVIWWTWDGKLVGFSDW
jgi:hypothetical protein